MITIFMWAAFIAAVLVMAMNLLFAKPFEWDRFTYWFDTPFKRKLPWLIQRISWVVTLVSFVIAIVMISVTNGNHWVLTTLSAIMFSVIYWFLLIICHWCVYLVYYTFLNRKILFGKVIKFFTFDKEE